ncbi:MAG: hypothetical protein FD160_2435 [Caulobacteraceae bacterium]|nr:MAG: hypothetical protein FD160_2435 [Caulobacteraceae bacterium]
MFRSHWRIVSVAAGFLVWALATTTLRVADVARFGGEAWEQVAVYACAAIAVFALPRMLSAALQARAMRVAVFLALPGMILDVGVLHLWPRVFPNLPAAEAQFGALMLWLYGMTLLSGATVGEEA